MSEQPYKYQHIIDNSLPITVERKPSMERDALAAVLRRAADVVEATPSEAQATWVYKCSPPERLTEDGANAPAYVPEEPSHETLAQWLMFTGLECLLEDAWSRAAARSKKHDKECRSQNLEKFDDSTFSVLQSTGIVRESMSVLKEKQSALLQNFRNPNLSMQEKLALVDQLGVLTEKIESLKRNRNDD